jgi:hypothetical protein
MISVISTLKVAFGVVFRDLFESFYTIARSHPLDLRSGSSRAEFGLGSRPCCRPSPNTIFNGGSLTGLGRDRTWIGIHMATKGADLPGASPKSSWSTRSSCNAFPTRLTPFRPLRCRVSIAYLISVAWSPHHREICTVKAETR